MPTKDYQSDLLQRLANREYAAQYLKAALDKKNLLMGTGQLFYWL